MGDPACWLQWTCDACGRLIEPHEQVGDRCPRCDAVLPPEPTGEGPAGG